MITGSSCSRCGHGAEAETPGSQSDHQHCRSCGHSWRWLDAGPDAFSFILAERVAGMAPMRDECLPPNTPRASRFSIRLLIRYRSFGDVDWHMGITENISRSGMLFRTEHTVDAKTPVELILELPSEVAGMPASYVYCRCEAVRTSRPEIQGVFPAVAVTVGDYLLDAN